MPDQTDKPHYIGHRRRLKDRFVRNPSGVAEYELLELLLGYALPRQDTKPLAKRLLERFSGLRGVLCAEHEDILAVNGVGNGVHTLLLLHRELLARMQEAMAPPRAVLSSPRAVADMARARFGAARREQLWAAFLDNKNRLLSWEKIAEGTVNQAPVYPREIFRLAITRQAASLILVHNHPGGDPTPSAQDRALMDEMLPMAKGLGLRILDHVVVCENGFFSFTDNGLFSPG